jgi:DNA-binding NtrC family response regulator
MEGLGLRDWGFEEKGSSSAGRGVGENAHPQRSAGTRAASQGTMHRRAENERGLQRKPSRNEILGNAMFAAKETVEIAVAQLVQEILIQAPPGAAAGQERATVGGANAYYRVQAVVERAMLCKVLEHVKGNQVEAADLLGISRTTLRSKLRSLGLVVEKQVSDMRD